MHYVTKMHYVQYGRKIIWLAGQPPYSGLPNKRAACLFVLEKLFLPHTPIWK